MKRFRVLKILLVITLVLAGAFYFLRIHRYPRTLDKNGWHMDYAVPLMACPCCCSRISRLEYNGTPIPMPGFPVADDRRWLRSSLDTPIGTFRIDNSLDGWRYFYGDGKRQAESDVPITEEDLQRGYYVPYQEQLHGPKTWVPKMGTPKHWCLLYGNTRCWLDPLRFDQIDWAKVLAVSRD